MTVAPMFPHDFPLQVLLSQLHTAIRDYALAHPEHAANVVVHCADVHNWMSANVILPPNVVQS
jgi:hypothetical protein